MKRFVALGTFKRFQHLQVASAIMKLNPLVGVNQVRVLDFFKLFSASLWKQRNRIDRKLSLWDAGFRIYRNSNINWMGTTKGCKIQKLCSIQFFLLNELS